MLFSNRFHACTAFSLSSSVVVIPRGESFLGASTTIRTTGTVFRPTLPTVTRGCGYMFQRVVERKRQASLQNAHLAAHEDYGDDSDSDDNLIGDANVVIDDLNWRVEKLRLEERNTRQFLRSGPRFLPYDECRKWVQAWGNRWNTEDDWRQWIAMGEKRNPYIPSRPDEYYKGGGQWVSWEHFLGVPQSAAEPADKLEDSTNSDESGTSDL